MTSSALPYAPQSLLQKLFHDIKWQSHRVFDAWQDRRLGIDASGLIEKDNLASPGPNAGHSYVYLGTPHAVLGLAFYHLRIAARHFTFIDLGSGKGRVLVRAARYPFARVEGVELSPKLHAVALENIKRASVTTALRSGIAVHNQDVIDYALPETPLVIFFFNSFQRVILRQFIEKVEQSLRDNPRDCYFIYLNPRNGDCIEEHSSLRRIPFSGLSLAAIRLVSPWPLAIYRFLPEASSAADQVIK